MSLGPVIRNALEQPKGEIKPHLRDRLGAVQYRPDGAITTDNAGKLTFHPAYGERPVAVPVARKEPAYIPFQGDNAYLNPSPETAKPKSAERTRELGTGLPALVAGRYALGQRVRKIKGFNTGDGVIDGFRENGAEMHVKWDAPTNEYDDGWWSTSAENSEKWEILGCAQEEPKAKHAFKVGDRVLKTEGVFNGRMATVRTVLGDELLRIDIDDGEQNWQCHYTKLEKAAPKIDPMKEPLKVGDRIMQIHPGFINQGKTAVVSSIKDGVMTVAWDGEDYIPGYPWSLVRDRCRFQLVERDGVRVC